MNRTLRVVRITTVSVPGANIWPWAILASAFFVNLAIFAVIGDDPDTDGGTGGLLSIYIVILVGYVAMFTQFFPFLLGLGVTRHRFFIATLLSVVAEALAYGVVLYLLKLLEVQTGGWGVDMRFFGLPFLVVDNPVAQILVYAGPFLLVALVGAIGGIVYTRWGAAGWYTMSLGSIVVVGAAVFLVTWQDGWGAVGRWFADSSPLALFAGWPVLAAALIAATAYPLLRRTAI